MGIAITLKKQKNAITRKTRSAILSKIIPVWLTVFVALAMYPSNISLIPQTTYRNRKIGDNGLKSSNENAPIILINVIIFAIFFIFFTSINSHFIP